MHRIYHRIWICSWILPEYTIDKCLFHSCTLILICLNDPKKVSTLYVSISFIFPLIVCYWLSVAIKKESLRYFYIIITILSGYLPEMACFFLKKLMASRHKRVIEIIAWICTPYACFWCAHDFLDICFLSCLSRAFHALALSYPSVLNPCLFLSDSISYLMHCFFHHTDLRALHFKHIIPHPHLLHLDSTMPLWSPHPNISWIRSWYTLRIASLNVSVSVYHIVSLIPIALLKSSSSLCSNVFSI